MQTARVQWLGKEASWRWRHRVIWLRLIRPAHRTERRGRWNFFLWPSGRARPPTWSSSLPRNARSLNRSKWKYRAKRQPSHHSVDQNRDCLQTPRRSGRRAVKHTIKLSEGKYCSVAATLRKSAEITFRYEITPAYSGFPCSGRPELAKSHRVDLFRHLRLA